MYRRSIDDVSEMFPQWHDTNEMALEDPWRRQGTHTWLVESELHGFPKEMPHDVTWKWKNEVQDEVRRRNQKVEEFSRSTNSAVVQPAQPVPLAAVPTRKMPPSTNRPFGMQMVPPPAWLKDLRQVYAMFQLSPPSVSPAVVKPEFHEVRFPAQFEIQSVRQMDFLGDGPLRKHLRHIVN